MPNFKIHTECSRCRHGGGLGDAAPNAEFDLTDSDYYPWSCPNGHENHLILQNQRFELLLEMGIHAARDGYPRELVVAFAGALERFYEFALRVLLQDESDHVATRFKKFDLLWQPIKKRSEQQLGAFQAVWLSNFGVTPAVLNSKRSEFRNDVVHNGHIPSKADAAGFCQVAYDAIFDNAQVLLDQKKPEVDWVVHAGNFESARPALEANGLISTMVLTTPFCVLLARDVHPRANVSRILGLTD